MSIKSETFSKELGYIQNPVIQNFFVNAVEGLPDYFFTVAASSSGKYHPSYALGEGGLVRHTKAAVGIAHDLLGLEQYKLVFSPDKSDLIIGALICHDGIKQGWTGGHTVAEHPLLAAEYLKNGNFGEMPDGYLEIVCGATSSHMGSWNTAYKSDKEILPKPYTDLQKFVHMCDYLASRKYLEYVFEQGSIDSRPAPAPQNPDTFIIPFGKYKGQVFSQVSADVDYFQWLQLNVELREPLKTMVDNLLKK